MTEHLFWHILGTKTTFQCSQTIKLTMRVMYCLCTGDQSLGLQEQTGVWLCPAPGLAVSQHPAGLSGRLHEDTHRWVCNNIGRIPQTSALYIQWCGLVMLPGRQAQHWIERLTFVIIWLSFLNALIQTKQSKDVLQPVSQMLIIKYGIFYLTTTINFKYILLSRLLSQPH